MFTIRLASSISSHSCPLAQMTAQVTAQGVIRRATGLKRRSDDRRALKLDFRWGTTISKRCTVCGGDHVFTCADSLGLLHA